MSDKIKNLVERYPELTEQIENINQAFNICKNTFLKEGTLFTCGNGGSAADAEHIAGELLKEFVLKRGKDKNFCQNLCQNFGDEGKFISSNLQKGLRTVALTSHLSFSTAFANDVDGELVFGQQLYSLGKKNDTVIGISTSGNSRNVVLCLMIAKEMGVKTIAMTGSSGGKCLKIADCCIMAPAEETHLVQEYHVPIYHVLCLMLEEYFYG